MKRVEHYCDACGKKISYANSDGDIDIQGITTSEFTIDTSIKIHCGEATTRKVMPKKEVCSYKCFSDLLEITCTLVQMDATPMKELK